jgi:hypothetical protein
VADPIELAELHVTAVASEESCRSTEEGFSSVTAEFQATDRTLIGRLRQAAKERTNIILRCGILEVEGVIGRLNVSRWGSRAKVVVALDDIRHRVPPEKRGLKRRPT